jgi:hypothetical protein
MTKVAASRSNTLRAVAKKQLERGRVHHSFEEPGQQIYPLP